MKCRIALGLLACMRCSGYNGAGVGVRGPPRLYDVHHAKTALLRRATSRAGESREMTIVPNLKPKPMLQQHQQQQTQAAPPKRLPGPKGFVSRDFDSYPCAVAPSTDGMLEMAALAVAEFKDWWSRIIKMNASGIPYEFDRAQILNSCRKWWARLLEADLEARQEFAVLYSRVVVEERAMDMGIGIDVSADWDDIYLEEDSLDEVELVNTYSFSPLGRGKEEEEGEGEGDASEEILDIAMRGRWHVIDNEVDFSSLD